MNSLVPTTPTIPDVRSYGIRRPRDPLAVAYINSVQADGVALNGAKQAAINTFVRQARGRGWITKFPVLHYFGWGNASSSARCIWGGSVALMWSGSITFAAGYAQGAGGYGVASGTSWAAIGSVASGAAMMFYNADLEAIGEWISCSYFNGAFPEQFIGVNASTPGQPSMNGLNYNRSLQPVGSDTRGVIVHNFAPAVSSQRITKAAGSLALTMNAGSPSLSTLGELPNIAPVIFGQHNESVFSGGNTSKLSGWGCGSAFVTSAESDAFSAAVFKLFVALGAPSF